MVLAGKVMHGAMDILSNQRDGAAPYGYKIATWLRRVLIDLGETFLWICVAKGHEMSPANTVQLDKGVSSAILALVVGSWGGQMWPENSVLKLVDRAAEFGAEGLDPRRWSLIIQQLPFSRGPLMQFMMVWAGMEGCAEVAPVPEAKYFVVEESLRIHNQSCVILCVASFTVECVSLRSTHSDSD